MTVRILISGATGVVGSALISRLLRERKEPLEVVALLRGASSHRRLRDLLGDDVGLVKCIDCDLTTDSYLEAAEALPPRETIGIHLAADVSWFRKYDDLKGINVEGTKRFAQILLRSAPVARIIYVSTAFTDTGFGFRNAYERSKSEAAAVLRDSYGNLSPVEFSCSLVVGNQTDGKIAGFHGLYPLLSLVRDYRPPFLVGHADSRIDIVPVDWVVEELHQLIHHLPPPNERTVVASAGPSSIALSALVELASTQIFGSGSTHQINLISYRRWSFLERSMRAWGVKGFSPRDLKLFKRLMTIYQPYLENGVCRPPRCTTTTAPPVENYLEKVIDYWMNYRLPCAVVA